MTSILYSEDPQLSNSTQIKKPHLPKFQQRYEKENTEVCCMCECEGVCWIACTGVHPWALISKHNRLHDIVHVHCLVLTHSIKCIYVGNLQLGVYVSNIFLCLLSVTRFM